MAVQPFKEPKLCSTELGFEPSHDKAQSQCFYLYDMFLSLLCIVKTIINMTFKTLYIPCKLRIFKSKLYR